MSGCTRNCPEGECHCAEPTYVSLGIDCGGCGWSKAECTCDWEDD